MFRYGFKKHLLDLGFEYESTVLAAVSGGVDSMCMLDALVHSSLDLKIAVAHVNFNLRGEESDADTHMVMKWCSENGVRLFSESFDTVSYAQGLGISIEMAARELRYNWFYKLMESEKFDFLAIAHNANDNAETLLLNLTRGCGIDGIAGIREKIEIPEYKYTTIGLGEEDKPGIKVERELGGKEIIGEELGGKELGDGKNVIGKRQFIIRPLLVYNRKQIEKYALKFNVPFRVDSSNMVSDYSRNRIRNEVFPQLEKINPAVIEVFNRDIRHFLQAGNVLSELVDERVSHLTHKFSSFKELFDSEFGQSICSLNLRMNCGMKGDAYPYLCNNYFVAEKEENSDEAENECYSPDNQSDEILSEEEEMCYGGENGVCLEDFPSILVCVVELKTLLAEKEWEFWLYNILKDYAFSTSVVEGVCKSILEDEGPKRFLSGSGEWICLKERGLLKVYNNLAAVAPLKIETLVIGRESWRTRRGEEQICPTLYMDADKVVLPLSFKGVEAGERFSPLGLRGSKKVTDYLTDIKFENLHKGNVVVMCDATDKIVCIPGLQISDTVKVTERTERVLMVVSR